MLETVQLAEIYRVCMLPKLWEWISKSEIIDDSKIWLWLYYTNFLWVDTNGTYQAILTQIDKSYMVSLTDFAKLDQDIL